MLKKSGLYCLAVILALYSAGISQNKFPEGIWQGTLKVPGQELRIVFTIVQSGENEWKSTLDSPDQGAKGIPVARTLVRGDSLIFDVKAVMGEFRGARDKEGKTVTGTWKQAGMTFTLSLSKTETAPTTSRPQEPKPPFPYVSEDVFFTNTKAGLTLAGTFTKPASGPSAFAAVVLVSGSGPQDRDESVFGHRPFLVLSDFLTKNGVAVLRYDDRGTGKSGGKYQTATTEDFTSDAAAAAEYLRSRKDVQPGRIGLIGHSEGALIAPLVASKDKRVGFVVLLAGPGMRGDDLLVLQGKAIAGAMSATPDQIEKNAEEQKKCFAILKETPDAAAAAQKLRKALTEFAATLTEEERTKTGMNDAIIDAQVSQMNSPWFRFFISYDPLPALEKTSCPVLALWGEKDLQVPPRQNLPPVEQALKKGGNKNIVLKILPGLNHLFQDCETGSIAEYSRIEETVSPAALGIIGDWIKKQK
jgi:pimeloyl-ACP methyl ester carboxylesterase